MMDVAEGGVSVNASVNNVSVDVAGDSVSVDVAVVTRCGLRE